MEGRHATILKDFAKELRQMLNLSYLFPGLMQNNLITVEQKLRLEEVRWSSAGSCYEANDEFVAILLTQGGEAFDLFLNSLQHEKVFRDHQSLYELLASAERQTKEEGRLQNYVLLSSKKPSHLGRQRMTDSHLTGTPMPTLIDGGRPNEPQGNRHDGVQEINDETSTRSLNIKDGSNTYASVTSVSILDNQHFDNFEKLKVYFDARFSSLETNVIAVSKKVDCLEITIKEYLSNTLPSGIKSHAKNISSRSQSHLTVSPGSSASLFPLKKESLATSQSTVDPESAQSASSLDGEQETRDTVHANMPSSLAIHTKVQQHDDHSSKDQMVANFILPYSTYKQNVQPKLSKHQETAI